MSAAVPRVCTLGLALPPQPPIEGIFRALSVARDTGMRMVTVWDHITEFAPPAVDPSEGTADLPNPADFEFQVLLGALADRAGDTQLGVGVTESIRRHPVVIAQAFLTLSHLTRRSPILGIGAGERINTEPFGLGVEHAVDRLAEALEVIRLCFGEKQHLDFSGRYFAFSNATFALRAPEAKTPRVWVGAREPRMLRLTGRYADGWYPADLADPAEYAALLEVVRAAASKAGRDPDEIEAAGELITFVASSDAEARDLLSSPDARFVGLLLPSNAWARRGLVHPLGDQFRGFVDYVTPSDEERARIDEALAVVPPDLVADHVLWGTPRRVADRIRALRDAGMRHVNLSFGNNVTDAAGSGTVRRAIVAITECLEKAP